MASAFAHFTSLKTLTPVGLTLFLPFPQSNRNKPRPPVVAFTAWRSVTVHIVLRSR